MRSLRCMQTRCLLELRKWHGGFGSKQREALFVGSKQVSIVIVKGRRATQNGTIQALKKLVWLERRGGVTLGSAVKQTRGGSMAVASEHDDAISVALSCKVESPTNEAFSEQDVNGGGYSVGHGYADVGLTQEQELRAPCAHDASVGISGAVHGVVVEAGQQPDCGRAGCSFWLARKKRFCTNQAKPGHRFCGNHIPDEALGFRRVPCPVDPSHTVPEYEVASHILRCPAAKQAQGVRKQPYFREGINAGSVSQEGAGGRDAGVLSSREKRALVEGLTEVQFQEFVSKIEDACAIACPRPLQRRIDLPESYRQWMEGGKESHQSPFSAKHWEQQASILGSMNLVGLIDPPGSGRLHRASLAETPGPSSSNRAASAEVMSDGSLREQSKEGLGVKNRAGKASNGEPGCVLENLDLESPVLGRLREGLASDGGDGALSEPLIDADAASVRAAEGPGSPDGSVNTLVDPARGGANPPEDSGMGRVFIEFGAGRGYLANALYECFGRSDVLFVERRAYKLKADRALRKVGKMDRIRIDIEDLDLVGVEGLAGREYVGAGKHLCGPATDATLRCCLGSGNGTVVGNGTFTGDEIELPNGSGNGDGIIGRAAGNGIEVAVGSGRDNSSGNGGKARNMSVNGVEQGGPEAGADVGHEGARPRKVPAVSRNGSREAPFCSGVAVATCCHHLCSWRTYVNKAFFRRLGFGPAEFHMLTWLTSWCVSGPKFGEHRGAGNVTEDHEVPGDSATDDVSGKNPGNRVVLSGATALGDPSTRDASGAVETNGVAGRGLTSAESTSMLDGRGTESVSGREVDSASRKRAGGLKDGEVTVGDDERVKPTVWNGLSLERRVDLGRMCKTLIDTGRLKWLAQEGFVAELIEYVDADVSPENRLLLATRTANLR